MKLLSVLNLENPRMADEKQLRIFDGICCKYPRRVFKGRKKKTRRMDRAMKCDGWERRKAGKLKPQLVSSKREFKEEFEHGRF